MNGLVEQEKVGVRCTPFELVKKTNIENANSTVCVGNLVAKGAMCHLWLEF